jgi:hypothetical protein
MLGGEPPTRDPGPDSARPWWKRTWVLIAAGVLAFLIVVGMIGALSAPDKARESSSRPPAKKAVELLALFPADGTTVHAPSVVVKGRVTPSGAAVVLNGDAVTPRDGRFRHRVRLSIGENTISVSAERRGFSSDESSMTITRRRTQQELAVLQQRREQRQLAREERARQRELEAEQQRQQEIAAATTTFSGSGSKNIGSIKVDQESILEWSNNGDPAFQMMLIYDEDFGISVSSEAASGDTVVPAGTYPNVTVAGDSSWTITIHPR